MFATWNSGNPEAASNWPRASWLKLIPGCMFCHLMLRRSMPCARAKMGNSLRSEPNAGPPIALPSRSLGLRMLFFFSERMPAGVASWVRYTATTRTAGSGFFDMCSIKALVSP